MVQTLDRWRHEVNFRMGASAGCRSTGSKLRGIQYHRRTYKALGGLPALPGKLLIEPWYRNMADYPDRNTLRSPDAVILNEAAGFAIVIEVKLNWKDGRDVKLIDEYLPIVKNAHGLDVTWPLLITQCLRGYKHPPLLGLCQLEKAMEWFPGDPTPLLLHL